MIAIAILSYIKLVQKANYLLLVVIHYNYYINSAGNCVLSRWTRSDHVQKSILLNHSSLSRTSDLFKFIFVLEKK